MRFMNTFFITAFTATSALAASPLIKRQTECTYAEEYMGAYGNTFEFSLACEHLEDDCIENYVVKGTTDLWSVKSCVASAVCDPKLAYLAQCFNSAVPNATDLPHLDYNVYAGIVGDCAWDEGGCPITQQNFIDLVYSALSETGSEYYPTSTDDVVEFWWQPLIDWTLTGDTVPYTNFDDWLHYDSVN